MADFTQTMKDWRRMCKQFAKEGLECEGCPLEDITPHACGAIFEDEFADVADWAELERRVTKWAKENPEPVYPTWAEYLNSIGVTISDQPFPAPNIPVYVYQAGAKMFAPIPADIAQKLGIESKEG